MTSPAPAEVADLFGRREQPVREFAEQAGQVAAACLDMATRFRRGGKLIAFGIGGASTDAQHVAGRHRPRHLRGPPRPGRLSG